MALGLEILVELHEGAEDVLALVVVRIDVLALEVVVAIKFHLLTSDTRTQHHSVGSLLTISQNKFLHLVEALALLLNSSIEDALGECDEIGTVGHEVGLTLQSEDSGEVVGNLHEHASIGGLTVAALGGDSQTTLTEQVLGFIEVAFSLGECLLDVGKTCTGNGAQLLDVFHIWFVSHNSMKIKY